MPLSRKGCPNEKRSVPLMLSMPMVEMIRPRITESRAFIWFLAAMLVMQLRPSRPRAKYSALWKVSATPASNGAATSMTTAEKMVPNDEAVTAKPRAIPAWPFCAIG